MAGSLARRSSVLSSSLVLDTDLDAGLLVSAGGVIGLPCQVAAIYLLFVRLCCCVRCLSGE